MVVDREFWGGAGYCLYGKRDRFRDAAGAMMARKSIVDWPKGSHGNTYGGNPISCAAAIATLQLLEDGMMQNASEVGSYTLDALSEIAVRHPSIGQVRGIGLMIGIEFVTDKNSKEAAPKLRDQVVDLAFERGLLLLGCGKSVIRISPPLCITREEVDEGLYILEEAIRIAENNL